MKAGSLCKLGLLLATALIVALVPKLQVVLAVTYGMMMHQHKV